jgi:L-rhamnose mutarotase
MASVVAPKHRSEPNTIAQERPWTTGSVWSVDFIRLKPGHGLEYARQLAETWKKMLDAQKKEGIVLSYRILAGSPSGREDFTHMLMVEYPNYSVFDQMDKADATTKQVYGSLASMQEMFRKREEIRENIGQRLFRELHFK